MRYRKKSQSLSMPLPGHNLKQRFNLKIFRTTRVTFLLGTLVAAIVLITCNGGSGTSSSSSKYNFDNSELTLPKGFGAVVVADKLGSGRHIVVNDNGDIYVSLNNTKQGGGIAALRDTNDDGKADIVKYFGDLSGTWIGIHDGYLYFGSNTSIVRYRLTPGELVPQGAAEVVVEGFPEQTQHAAKSFAFDDAENLYVNVGAPSNACQEKDRTPGSPGQDPCPLLEWHGGIWEFNANTTGQTQIGDGHRFATGIRNAVAINWNNFSNHLYIVQHGRDQLHQLFGDYYTAQQGAELPAEEFFLLNDGDNCGWPYSYYDQFQEKRVLAPEYGGDGKKVGRADQYKTPILAFPGHWAPDDLLFYQGDLFPASYKNGAFIAFHGSWNRAPLPQQGYKVVFVPFSDQNPATGDYDVFADGFAQTNNLQSSGDAKYRPCGLAEGPDGSLYIVDSNQGKVWRILPTS